MTTNNPTHQIRGSFGNTDTYIRRDGSDMTLKDGNNSEVTLTDLQSGGSGSGGAIFASGLRLRNDATNPNYQLDFDADIVGMLNASNEGITIRSVTETFDISTDLDTGSEASSTWYYCWLISDDGSTITDTLVSTSATLPTGIAAGDYRLMVGSIYNDSSSNFRRIDKVDNWTQYYDNTNDRLGLRVATGDTANVWTSIGISAYIPPHCYLCHGTVHNRGGHQNWAAGCAPQALDATNPNLGVDGVPAAYVNDSSLGGGNMRTGLHWECVLQTAQTLYWLSDGTSNNHVHLVSYWDELYS